MMTAEPGGVQPRRVLIVGAGFSRQLSIDTGFEAPYPTMESFWSFAKKQREASPDIHGWDPFWRFYEEIETELGIVPDVEQLLDMVEHAIGSNEHLWVREISFDPSVIKKELIFTITTVLTLPLERRRKVVPNYLKPVEPIFDKLGGKSIDAVISFNWDVLLDDALFGSLSDHVKESIIVPERVLYGLPECFIRIGSDERYSQVGQSVESRSHKAFVHLKLHGSLNWRKCPQGHVVIERPAIGTDIRCPIDHSRTEYFIVPPSTVKNYSDFALSTVWKDAGERLVRADEIVIYGFSFRTADYAARNLLLTAFARSETAKDLIIVDPKASDVGQTLETLLGRKIHSCRTVESWKNV